MRVLNQWCFQILEHLCVHEGTHFDFQSQNSSKEKLHWVFNPPKLETSAVDLYSRAPILDDLISSHLCFTMHGVDYSAGIYGNLL